MSKTIYISLYGLFFVLYFLFVHHNLHREKFWFEVPDMEIMPIFQFCVYVRIIAYCQCRSVTLDIRLGHSSCEKQNITYITFNVQNFLRIVENAFTLVVFFSNLSLIGLIPTLENFLECAECADVYVFVHE